MLPSLHQRAGPRPYGPRPPRFRLRPVFFLAIALSHGLRLRTAAGIAQQLASEKSARRDVRWKRVGLLEILLTDIFLYYYRKVKPAFATFFLNSTAHLQHAYWRCMEPERFLRAPDPGEAETYGDAILFGYQNMDRLLPDFFKLEQGGVTLAMVTALSQQPFLKHEASGGQRFYRPRNLAALLELAAVRPRTIEPLMARPIYAPLWRCARKVSSD